MVEHGDDGEGDRDRDDGAGAQREPDVAGVARARAASAWWRASRFVRFETGQEQRPGVGDPQRRQGERVRRGADLARDREPDRGEQHGGRVEAEERGARHGEAGEQEPEQPDPVPARPGDPMAETSNTPASWAISATTVIARRKTTIGLTRAVSAPRSAPVTGPGATSRTQGAPRRAGSWSAVVEAAEPRPRRGRGTRRRRPALEAEVAGDEPPGVLGEVARPGHPDRDPAVGEVAAGRPGRGIRRRTGSRRRPRAPAAAGEHPRQLGAPERGQRAEPGQADPHREAVGRDPVGEAHRAVERRDDDEPPGGPAPGGRVEGGEVERVVEDAGVDLGRRGSRARCRGRGCARCRRGGRADAEQRRGRRGSGSPRAAPRPPARGCRRARGS